MNNVINFPNRPANSKKWIPLPKNQPPDGRFRLYELAEDRFGFVRGTEFTCRTDFDVKELKPDSLVIALSSDEPILTVFGLVEPKDVLATVLEARREV